MSKQLPQVILVMMVRIYLQKSIVSSLRWLLSAIKTERSCLTDSGAVIARAAPTVVSRSFLALVAEQQIYSSSYTEHQT